jgi:hypothetical protein
MPAKKKKPATRSTSNAKAKAKAKANAKRKPKVNAKSKATAKRKARDKTKARLIDRTFLTAFDSLGNEVERVELNTHDYYDELHDLIDDDDYRSRKGVRSLRGELYGSRGKLLKKFECRYSAEGAIVFHRAEHDDGTVQEETIEPDSKA